MEPIIYLHPLFHGGKTFVRLSFQQDKSLFQYLCQQQDILRYSQTFKCLVTHYKKEPLYKLKQLIKGRARLDTSALMRYALQANVAATKKAIPPAASLPLVRLLVGKLAGKFILLIRFRYHRELFQHLKTHPQAHYYEKGKCWYMYKEEVKLDTFIEQLQPFARLHLDPKLYPLDYQSQKQLLVGHSNDWGSIDSDPFLHVLYGKGYSNSTISTYFSLMGRFIKHADFEDEQALKEVSSPAVNSYHSKWVAQGHTAAGSINQSVNAIKFYMLYVLKRPLEGVELVRVKKEKTLPKVMSLEEVSAILCASDNLKHRCMLSLLYSGGLRAGELIKLKISDVDWERKQICLRQAKGKKDRMTLLSSVLYQQLHAYLQQYQPVMYLFEGQWGDQYTGSSLRSVFKQALTKAKIKKPFTLHCLRHSRFGDPICYSFAI